MENWQSFATAGKYTKPGASLSSAKRNCTAQPPRGAELDRCSDGSARGCRRGGCRMPTLPVMICPPSSFRGLGTAHPCHALPGRRRAVYAPPCSRADDGLPLRSQSRRTLQRQLSLFGMPLLPRIPVTYAFVPLPAHLTIVLRAAIMLTLLKETTARPSAAFSQGTAAGRLQVPAQAQGERVQGHWEQRALRDAAGAAHGDGCGGRRREGSRRWCWTEPRRRAAAVQTVEEDA